MKISYRPEIDGLRAIAVLVVVMYHAGFDYFQGGYLGVDIFFVISGYLITSILLKELEETNRLSITLFYERRIRRILPALFLVMLASLPLAWIYLPSTDYINFAESILYALGFGSNFFFYFSGLEYGATQGEYLPFLHTWSLSVEEQFYLIFPLLLFLSYKYLKKYILLIFSVGLVISLMTADYTSQNDSSMGFYYLHTRMWELLAGSVLSYLEITKGRNVANSDYTKFLPFLGFVLVLIPIFIFGKKTPHPSILTSLPIIGVCLIIWFSQKREAITWLLSRKIFVGVGLISYSFYLWHYPIFAFFRIHKGWEMTKPSEMDMLSLIILSLMLSILTYYLVEKPFRNNKKTGKKKLFVSLLSVFFVITVIQITVVSNKGFENKFSYLGFPENYEMDNLKLQRESWKFLLEKHPEYSGGNKTKVLFIGNSHSKDMFNAFYQNRDLFDDFEFSRIGNYPNFRGNDLKADDWYTDSPRKLLNYEQFIEAEVVVITERYAGTFDNIPRLIEFLKEQKKKIVLLSQTNAYPHIKTPKLSFVDRILLDELRDGKTFQEISLKEIGTRLYKNRKKKIENTNKILEKIAADYNVIYLRKQDFLCDDEKSYCDPLTNDGYKIYYDYGHYTLEGAKHFGEKIHKMGWFKLN